MSAPHQRLSWDDLARAYDAAHPGGRRARTLPMDDVFDWAKAQTEQFWVDGEGYIYRVEAENRPR